MVNTSTDTWVLECDSCGNTVFSGRSLQCCDEPMNVLERGTAATNPPDLDVLLRDVFGMSSTELDVCLCVMGTRETTIAEIADQLDVDRSLVSRHLNHLTDLGVVEKTRRLRTEGGHVNIYTPADRETVKRRLETELYDWMRDAVDTIDQLTAEKVQAIAEISDYETEPRIYE